MKLTKEEQEKLLAEAKKIYVVNITFRSAFFKSVYTIKIKPEFKFDSWGDLFISNHRMTPYVSHDGQWAEIIPSEPLEPEELPSSIINRLESEVSRLEAELKESREEFAKKVFSFNKWRKEAGDLGTYEPETSDTGKSLCGWDGNDKWARSKYEQK